MTWLELTYLLILSVFALFNIPCIIQIFSLSCSTASYSALEAEPELNRKVFPSTSAKAKRQILNLHLHATHSEISNSTERSSVEK